MNKRIRTLNVLTFLIVGMLLVIGVAASMSGMNRLKEILDTNEKTRVFWNAISAEGNAFEAYLNTEQDQAYEKYRDAENATLLALNELPFDYNEMTLEQYSQTISIKNTYEKYKMQQRLVLSMNRDDSQYLNVSSKYYDIQKFIEGYAGELENLTAKQSSVKYNQMKSIFYVIPGICVITGLLVILIFMWLTKRSTNKYVSTIEEKHQVENKLVETRYQMLKNQMNPHFLFNTLNLIASTAEIEDAHTTEKMIVTLSRLFRYNLKSQTAVMPLEQELKVVDDYMYLQKMRFGQRIKYRVCANPETLQILVPSFVLQPIVENAVVHGLSKSSKGGSIYVKSWIKNDTLWISVADTGEGMEEDALKLINKKITNKKVSDNENFDKESGTGIALINIAERIQSMYDDGGMKIYSKKDHGTAVQLFMGKK